jgi:prolyl-tRNA synthetase
MRLSQMLLVTLKDDPADAEIPSHKLLLRAGYIRRIGSGIYAYLPLMWRVLRNVSQIVREEMDATGALECLLPQLQPAELWQESGRWDTYRSEGIMFTLTDRQDRDLGLGPTHEEVITAVARDLIRSYRQLPTNLYQIQTKFRDEIRPRFGLMRGREFIMKDAYSFHSNEDSLRETYAAMDQAYRNIFRRCGLKFRAVQADSGAIGGSASQEFMILAEAGEDEILYTEDDQYAANVEKAISLPIEAVPSTWSPERRATPNSASIEGLCKTLDCSPTQIVKTVLYQATYDNGKTLLVLACIRGDQAVNDIKLTNELNRQADRYGAKTLLALIVPDFETQKKWFSRPLPLGYIGPDLADDYIAPSPTVIGQFLRLADPTAIELTNFVAGANEKGFHLLGANWGQEFTAPPIVDLRTAKAGDRAVHDPSQTLLTARGIEAGHIFQLGLKYSSAMNANFTDESGSLMPMWMGCYGIGVSRVAQAAVEQSHDKNGIIWPLEIAPFQAIVVIPNIADADQVQAAESLYTALNQAGVEALLDDRDERAGFKFKDADLIGIPVRIVTGKSLKDGNVEVVKRSSGESMVVAIDDVVALVQGWVQGEGAL